MSDSAYSRFRDAIQLVPEGARHEVDQLCSQAVSYVWGYQDAGGEVKDTDRSTEFGYAYGVVAARSATPGTGVGMRPPIQDAWKSWQEHGEIRNWKGERICG